MTALGIDLKIFQNSEIKNKKICKNVSILLYNGQSNINRPIANKISEAINFLFNI